jgi:hypothetical protein
VRSFKAFLLIGALFLVVLVSLYVVAMIASSRRRIVVGCFEDEEFQGSNKKRAVRVAFR